MRSSAKLAEQERLVSAAKFAAQHWVDTEKGDGEAKLARAEKDALANQRLSAARTPLLLQHEVIHKLSDKIRLMVVPQGQTLLMQMSSLGAQN
jgi:hypothetical protein